MNRPARWLATMLTLLFAASADARIAQDQIRAVDAQFRRAMIEGDAKGMDRLVADDAKIIHGGNGAVQDKKGLIDRFRDYHIDRYDRRPLLLTVDGGLAVMVSVTHKVAGGHGTDTSTTEVFVRRAGQWQILVLQNTDHKDG